MDAESLLAGLERVASALSIHVRYEPCEDGAGGLCCLRGEQIIIVDSALPTSGRAAVLAAALAQTDTEGVFMMPAVREAIEGAALPPR